MEHGERDRFRDLRLLAYVCNAVAVDQPMNLTYHCEFGKLVYLSASSLHITSVSSVITELKHFFALAHVLICTSCKCDRSSFRKKRQACPRITQDPDLMILPFLSHISPGRIGPKIWRRRCLLSQDEVREFEFVFARGRREIRQGEKDVAETHQAEYRSNTSRRGASIFISHY